MFISKEALQQTPPPVGTPLHRGGQYLVDVGFVVFDELTPVFDKANKGNDR